MHLLYRIVLLLFLGASVLTPPAAFADALAQTVSDKDWQGHWGEGATCAEAMDKAVRACGGTEFCRREVGCIEADKQGCIAHVDDPAMAAVGWSDTPETAVLEALKQCLRGGGRGCVLDEVRCNY
ncbi:MAG: hypothetical protein V3573_01120 [Desulfovibrionaceae bacterium]